MKKVKLQTPKHLDFYNQSYIFYNLSVSYNLKRPRDMKRLKKDDLKFGEHKLTCMINAINAMIRYEPESLIFIGLLKNIKFNKV